MSQPTRSDPEESGAAERAPSARPVTDDPGGSARANHHRGQAVAARLWAQQQGLEVPAHGPVPETILTQYRRRCGAD